GDLRLFAAARTALGRAWVRRTRVRHLRMDCYRLTCPPAQLELFAADAAATRRQDCLMTAIDAVRRRFGPTAICCGSTLEGRWARLPVSRFAR
ncbi:MAG: hypothetical protein WAK95_19360, partial [Desulfobacterales bacterium]